MKTRRTRFSSERKLTAALFALMQVKPYSDISISGLTQQAGLSRRTFYRHFSGMDDVLDRAFVGFASEFCNFAMVRPHTHFEDFALSLFTFWSSKLHVLELLKRNGLLTRELQTFMTELFRLLLPDVGEGKEENKRSEAYEFGAYFTAGALVGLLTRWVQGGGVQTAESMASLVRLMAVHLATGARLN